VPDVTVRALNAREVEVTTASTVHRVIVDDGVLGALGWTDPTPGDLERLVAASFAFLLAREPAEAILRRFELSVIGSYFPGYLREIGAWAG
jgi:hypothetical protein